jgi:hypothetical protein
MQQSISNASLYGPLNQILTAFGAGDRIKPLSKTVANPLLIQDESLTNLGPQITAAALASGNATLVALAPYLGQHTDKPDKLLLEIWFH